MQKDLFGGSVATPIIPNTSESRYDFLQRYRINLRLDQVVIAALLLVVAYVFVFSFGVESGKRYAMAEIKSERSMRERMARELVEKIFSVNREHPEKASSFALSQETPGKPVFSSVDAYIKTSEPTSTKNDLSQPSSTRLNNENSKFIIQTVTFTSKAAAEKQIQKLASKGYQGLIIPRGKFQQVCVSGFESKEKAMSTMGRLKSQGLAPADAYIRRLA